MDISTYCNAGCPQCHRTNPNGLDKQDWLPLMQWSIEQFKKAFPKETLKNIKRFHFCGTFGDPMMVKDILPIIKYIIDNARSLIYFDTNGSMRNEDFWWELGVVAGGRLTVRFDVDGINQEMHSHYRRFTELDKVLEHMSILSNTKAHAVSQSIIFKHNQDYKKEIEELCREHGSLQHEFVSSNRFELGPTTHHTDEDGNAFVLEEATGEDEIEQAPIKVDLTNDIKCSWAKPRNEVVISYDGQVLPCCYHQNAYHTKFTELMKENDSVYKEYEDDKLKYNIFHTPLGDILTSEWYLKTLPDSMKNKPIEICSRYCSVKCN